jgi:hypothetical protein
MSGARGLEAALTADGILPPGPGQITTGGKFMRQVLLGSLMSVLREGCWS